MPINGFDYKAFAIDLAKQAMEVIKSPGSMAVPDSLSDADKKYIIETVRKFCYMAGEALSNDPQLNFNAEQASLVTQFIGEWTFHKSIDLIVGKIPPQNRDSILQIIAANIFNTAKLAIIKNLPKDSLISLIEEKVKQVYDAELEKLVKKGLLSPSQFESAKNTSNLNNMVQKAEDQTKLEHIQETAQEPSSIDKKVLKYAALAIILKKLPQEKANEILNSLDSSIVQHVINYMKMSNIEDKIDHNIIIKSLEEIRKIIPVPDVVNVKHLLKKHHKLLKLTAPNILSDISINEREAVRDFILDVKFPASEVFSPRVIQSLVKSIEDKVNDY